jgi:hypothetical protein
MDANYRGFSYRSLSFITLGGNFKLRKIFTLKNNLDKKDIFVSSFGMANSIPTNLDFPVSVQSDIVLIDNKNEKLPGTAETLVVKQEIINISVSLTAFGSTRSQKGLPVAKQTPEPLAPVRKTKVNMEIQSKNLSSSTPVATKNTVDSSISNESTTITKGQPTDIVILTSSKSAMLKSSDEEDIELIKEESRRAISDFISNINKAKEPKDDESDYSNSEIISSKPSLEKTDKITLEIVPPSNILEKTEQGIPEMLPPSNNLESIEHITAAKVPLLYNLESEQIIPEIVSCTDRQVEEESQSEAKPSKIADEIVVSYIEKVSQELENLKVDQSPISKIEREYNEYLERNHQKTSEESKAKEQTEQEEIEEIICVEENPIENNLKELIFSYDIIRFGSNISTKEINLSAAAAESKDFLEPWDEEQTREDLKLYVSETERDSIYNSKYPDEDEDEAIEEEGYFFDESGSRVELF